MTDPTTAEIRSFAVLITGLEDGVHDDLTQKVEMIVKALRDVRASQGGKPKAKLDISLEFKLDRDVVEIIADSKATLPKLMRARTLWYATSAGKLSTRNPTQMELGFRDVNAAAPVLDAR